MESFYTISPIKRLFFQKNKLRFKKKRLLFTIFYTICRSNFIQFPRYTKSPIKTELLKNAKKRNRGGVPRSHLQTLPMFLKISKKREILIGEIVYPFLGPEKKSLNLDPFLTSFSVMTQNLIGKSKAWPSALHFRDLARKQR